MIGSILRPLLSPHCVPNQLSCRCLPGLHVSSSWPKPLPHCSGAGAEACSSLSDTSLEGVRQGVIASGFLKNSITLRWLLCCVSELLFHGTVFTPVVSLDWWCCVMFLSLVTGRECVPHPLHLCYLSLGNDVLRSCGGSLLPTPAFCSLP